MYMSLTVGMQTMQGITFRWSDNNLKCLKINLSSMHNLWNSLPQDVEMATNLDSF